jgi:hypothetical protein
VPGPGVPGERSQLGSGEVISSVSQLKKGDLLQCRQAHYCVEDFTVIAPGTTALVVESDHLQGRILFNTEGNPHTTQITGVSLGYWDIVSDEKENV